MLGRVRRRVAGALDRIRERYTSTAVILMYHRIAEPEVDPWGIAVSPANFEEHLQIVRESGEPTRLAELSRALDSGTVRRNSVVVTFDDGYLDNLTVALPLLEKYEVPATIFFTTRQFEDGTSPFWWETVERAVLLPARLPDVLELRIGQTSARWELGRATEYTRDDREQDRGVQPWKAEDGSRLRFYHDLYEALRVLPSALRDDLLADLVSWAGAAPGLDRTQLISSHEVGKVLEGGLIDVGAHTVTHPFLATLAPEDQEREIVESRAHLEELTARPVRSFAYPHGQVTERSLSVARVHFDCACGIQPRPVTRWSDPFHLPRFQAPNCDGETLASLLQRRDRQ